MNPFNWKCNFNADSKCFILDPLPTCDKEIKRSQLLIELAPYLLSMTHSLSKLDLHRPFTPEFITDIKEISKSYLDEIEKI